MATDTELIRLQDVLKSEAPNFYCRKKETVLDGQVISMGEVCKLDSNGKIITATGAAADMVQTITTTGTATGGQIGINFAPLGDLAGEYTLRTASPWSATEATMTASILAAMDAVFGASDVVTIATIADTDIPVIVLTFGGTGAAGLQHRLVDVDIGGLTGSVTATVAITTNAEGSGDATHVALEAVSPSGADGAAVFLVRGPSIVDGDRLTVATSGKAAAVAALLRVGILSLDEASQLTAGEEG
jgi:hypothetical protein